MKRINKLHKDSPTEISGFIGEGTILQGEVHFKNAFRIDGKLKGKIVSEDMLIIGNQGDVEAEVDVGVLSVSGVIRGTIRARERLEIHANGKIYGSVTLDKPNFIIEEGGVLEGKVDMKASGNSDEVNTEAD